MEHMIISEPTKIILNGFNFLFEPGDKISVKSKEEVIKEDIEEFNELDADYKKLYKIHSNLETEIRKKNALGDKAENLGSPTDKIDSELKKLIKQKKRVKWGIENIEKKMVIKGGELEKYGYGTNASRRSFLKKHIEGNQAEAEAEEKEKRNKEIAAIDNEIGDLKTELEKAKESQVEFANSKGWQVVNGQWQSPSGEDEYEPLSAGEAGEMEEYFKTIGGIESKIDELEKFEYAEQAERDEEGLDGELDTGRPELTDEIMTPEQLQKIYPTGDEWDDPDGIALGDRISQWLIEGGFQPPELGNFSDMIKVSAAL